MKQFKVSFNLPDEDPVKRFYQIVKALNEQDAYGRMMEDMCRLPWRRSVEQWPYNVTVEEIRHHAS